MRTPNLRKFLNVYSLGIVASIALYIACLFLPAFRPMTNGSPGQIYTGLLALALGPLGFIALNFSWLANVCLWFGWSKIIRQRQEAAIAWCLGALAFALSFLLYPKIPVGSSGAFAFEVMIGYDVWIASIAFALISSMVIPRATTRMQDAEVSSQG